MNISISKTSVWTGLALFWILLISMCSGAFAQANWTNIGNGLQTRVVSGFREYRFTAITGYQPFNVTDSLKKKLTAPSSLIPGVVLGTTLSTSDLGLVGYSQTPMGDQLAMYNFGGQLSTADPVDPTDAVNKQYMESGLSGKVSVSELGVPGGVATLGADGKVPNNQIPALAISETFVVASQVAMLAVSGADEGDVAVRTDISKSFILTASPASTLSNWQELLTPTAAVSSVNGQVGNVNLTTSNIAEGTNLYYTEARVNANTNVAANTANRHAPVSIGTANGLSLNGQQISMSTASGSTTGTLTAADWNTFNSKQEAGSYALTNGTNAEGTWPIGITGNAATVTNGVYTNGSYSNPSWLTGLAFSKVTGFNSGSVTTALGYTPYNPASYPVNLGGETLSSVAARGAVAVNDLGITKSAPKFSLNGSDAIGSIGRLSFTINGAERAFINANRHTAAGQLTSLGFGTMGTEWMTLSNTGQLNVTGAVTASGFNGNLNGNATTASSVPWTGVTGKPSFFSGDYNDLSNKPTIPTNTNQLTNGAGFITSSALTPYMPIAGGEFEGVVTVKMNSPSASVVLDVGGYTRAWDFIVNSDSTLKKNIKPLTGSIKNLQKLKGYSYDWKRDDRHAIGIIAQEVQKVYPEIVYEDKGILSVDYSKLVAPLIMANNEQQKEIDQLKKDIAELKELIKK